MLNPHDSQISLIKVSTDQTDKKFNTNSSSPRVTFENGIEYVVEVRITLVSTINHKLPQNPVKLSILACVRNKDTFTKSTVKKSMLILSFRVENFFHHSLSLSHLATPIRNLTSNIQSTSTTSSSLSKDTTTTQLVTKRSQTCEHNIALIPEQIIKENSTLIPRYFVKPRTPYNPTDINPGDKGVSFPSSDNAYIIIFPISPPAIIKSIRLPKTTNVDQMRVMFLDEQDRPITLQSSVDHVLSQITSMLEKNPTISTNLSTKISAAHITLIHTYDNQPPENVTVEIIICAEPSKTYQSTAATSKASTTSAIIYTLREDIELLNYIISFFALLAPTYPCKPKRKPPAHLVIGQCISRQKIQEDSCVGYCPSYEVLDPLNGMSVQKKCSCCTPDLTYSQSIAMDCHNTTTGQNERRTSQIVRIQSCKCSMCLETKPKIHSIDKKIYETVGNTKRSKIKTKARR